MASHLTDDQLRALYAQATAARRDPSRVACPSPDEMLALVRREGAEQRRLEVLDHVMACAECRRDFELLRAIESSRLAEAGTAVEHIRWRRPLGVALVTALAAALAIFAVLGPWQSWRRATDRTEVFRGDASSVTVISPADRAALPSDTLAFLWHSVAGARRYTLEVLTPDGAVIASRQTTDTVLALRDPALVPGDYRWWVRAQLDGGERRSPARHLHVGPQAVAR